MIDPQSVPSLPRDDNGPTFREPWEAQAFALAVTLSQAGCFTWSEWAAVLSEEIHAAQVGGDPDLGATYYHHWLNALERICKQKGLVAAAEIERRKEEWHDAYLHTPHGQPVEIRSQKEPPAGAQVKGS